MSISRNEFLRSLPDAVGGAFELIGEDRFAGAADGGTWTAELVRLADLRIAALSLPRHRVKLRLEGLEPQRQRAFLARWEVHFRRGGG